MPSAQTEFGDLGADLQLVLTLPASLFSCSPARWGAGWVQRCWSDWKLWGCTASLGCVVLLARTCLSPWQSSRRV